MNDSTQRHHRAGQSVRVWCLFERYGERAPYVAYASSSFDSVVKEMGSKAAACIEFGGENPGVVVFWLQPIDVNETST